MTVGASTRATTPTAHDPRKVRADFPALAQEVYGKPLVYLDNAATSQKPQEVIDAVSRFYEKDCANVHRGVHALSVRATQVFEETRRKVQRFVGAASDSEIVFVRGATEGLNLIAQAYGRPRLAAGDEILLTQMEHHSNIVPWQMLCEQTGAVLRVAPIDDDGALIFDEFQARIGDRTRIVAATYVSNALGTVNPIREMTAAAHAAGAAMVVDAAQAAPHGPIDVAELDCDFLVLTGHKMYGPTGAGVVYGKRALLEAMPPWQGGGEMITSVTFEKTEYNEVPHKFEAGTPDIAAVYGLGAAVDYLGRLDLRAVAAYEHELLAYATEKLREVPGLRLYGTAAHKAAVLSFTLDPIHPHDAGTILDQQGVAVRTGHHCAQPVMERFGIPATVRASLGIYNTREDVDALVHGLAKVQEMFA